MEKTFWVDADVFIQSQNGLYSLDLAPPFWSFIDKQVSAGRIRSSTRIYKEVLATEDLDDDLAKWFKTRKTSGMFIDPATSRKVQEKCGEINDFVSKHYVWPKSGPKVAVFLSGGDTWIIAHACCDNGIVVSHEHRVDRTSQTPKIPNVCTQFGVECIGLREMLMRLKFKFK
jgi:hypothetical protein